MLKSKKIRKIISLLMIFILVALVMPIFQSVHAAAPLPIISIQSDVKGAYFKTASGPFIPQGYNCFIRVRTRYNGVHQSGAEQRYPVRAKKLSKESNVNLITVHLYPGSVDLDTALNSIQYSSISRVNKPFLMGESRLESGKTVGLYYAYSVR
jgi:hypothetical protein